MKTIAIPVSVFQVECEIASGRPFSIVERTIVRSISVGNDEYDRLLEDLCLHPRIVAEALTSLFEAGIIEFQEGTGAYSITPLGAEALHDTQFIPSTLRLMRRPYRIVVERLTGLADVGSNVTFERTNELRDHGVAILAPSDVDPTPGRHVVRHLVERQLQPGEWVRSVGRPEPEFRYNSSVQADLQDGRVERLRSPEWVRALTFALRDRGFDLAEPAPREPLRPWISVAPHMLRAVSGASEHAALIEDFLKRSAGYVFIHSAFLTGKCAEQLVQPITSALHRGVDVLLARGGTEEVSPADNDGVAVFKKLSYDERLSKGRFYFESYPTASHAKILVRDGEEVCIGSYNWLSGRPDSSRAELSLCISCPEFAAVVGDAAADLFREGSVAWPAQIMRTRVKHKVSNTTNVGMEIRLVMDAENRDCLFDYLDNSSKRLLIFSDKVTSKEDSLLHDKLLRSAHMLSAYSGLVIRFNSTDGDNAPILEGLTLAGASVTQDGSNHSKALVSDDARALVTSFNLLSFGGHSSRRGSAFEVGVEIRNSDGEPNFIKTLFGGLYH
jgi:predicted transcriptional regulator